MTNTWLGCSVLALALTALPACTGTDVGNPVDIDFALYETSFPGSTTMSALAPEGTGQVELSGGWLAVQRVRLRPWTDCTGATSEPDIDLEGPFVVDLRAPGAVPELSGLPVRSAEYCRFEAAWAVLEEPVASAPPALVGASLVIEGMRGDGVRFVVRSRRGDEIQLEAEGMPFVVSEAAKGLFVGFQGPLLFAGLDLGTADIAGDGTIYIDDSRNEPLLQVFDDNVAAAIRLFEDGDGDGELDRDESEAEDILARSSAR